MERPPRTRRTFARGDKSPQTGPKTDRISGCPRRVFLSPYSRAFCEEWVFKFQYAANSTHNE